MGNCVGCECDCLKGKSNSNSNKESNGSRGGGDVQMIGRRLPEGGKKLSSPVRRSVGNSDSSPQSNGSGSAGGWEGGSPVSPRARMGSRSSSFRSLMSGMVHGVMGKKGAEPVHICKLCQQPLKENENVCHCLVEEMYPNNKETNQQIREQYLQNRELIHSVTHLEHHPEKLVKFVEEVYHIIEKSAIKEDLSPASMAKAKENLVNHLCTHLEDIIVEES